MKMYWHVALIDTVHVLIIISQISFILTCWINFNKFLVFGWFYELIKRLLLRITSKVPMFRTRKIRFSRFECDSVNFPLQKPLETDKEVVKETPMATSNTRTKLTPNGGSSLTEEDEFLVRCPCSGNKVYLVSMVTVYWWNLGWRHHDNVWALQELAAFGLLCHHWRGCGARGPHLWRLCWHGSDYACAIKSTKYSLECQFYPLGHEIEGYE